MPSVPWRVSIRDHPGSTEDEIANEPDWAAGHQHRIGFMNRADRRPGFTHADDERYDDFVHEQAAEASQEYKELHARAEKGDLVDFRDLVEGQKDLHLKAPGNRPVGWRYVLSAREDWVKNEEPWPANIEKRKKEEEEKKRRDDKERQKNGSDDKHNDKSTNNVKSDGDDHGEASKGDIKKKDSEDTEELWKRTQGDGKKHHDAYARDANSDSGYSSESGSDEENTEYEKLREKYSPQEIALLRSLQHESSHIKKLKQNDGKRKSPQTQNRTHISIDEADQFSPDNWIPRSEDLIRLTGKHPLNAEPELTALFKGGLITPNELHYVRNHGAVPHILWEYHKVEVEGIAFSMNDIKEKFETINIPVILACDGNRRKELNMIKRSKGFNWGAGAVSCAYWKGPLLRDVLLAAGVKDKPKSEAGKRWWINFVGADEPSEGAYETCIPFEYGIDPTNDVILAYEMNDLPLPPDHGYPVRMIIPGYVGGRNVKWLKKIWVSDKENDSHYHIWDNRVLPSFVTEKDGNFAETLFRHPDTACNEQNLNSAIAKPAQGEKIKLSQAKKGATYRLEGYAYDGGGHEVQRVEVSLDGGETWLYCIRNFPDYPIRHGNKFWCWLHWHLDVEITHLLQAKRIIVRCFNVFKNTQPETPSWNLMGMMNNCWYVVKPEIVQDEDDDTPAIMFRHPVEAGNGEGGWMKPSTENQIAQAKQEAGAPSKQFTREEIEKHDKEDDCWLVVDGKVYDATSVLSWHPGGKSAILGHAGKVHQATSDEFSSVHDGYAYQKLKECILGVVTPKAQNFIKAQAEASAKEKASSTDSSSKVTLQKHRWIPVKLLDRKSLSDDTRSYTFSLPDDKTELGLGTCQHVQIGYHFQDRMVIRSYTPTRPILPALQHPPSKSALEQKGQDPHNQPTTDPHDGLGTFELVVKTYFPSPSQPGGAMSNILDCMPLGEEVEVRGPTGEIVYNGNGAFTIGESDFTFKRVSLVLGGSGITPGYALIARILLSENDKTEIRVVDANKSEADILLRKELEEFEKKSEGQLKVAHILSHPSEEWKGRKGHVDEGLIKEVLFESGKESVVFLCGPPGMIQKAAMPALKGWGYVEDENCFGF